MSSVVHPAIHVQSGYGLASSSLARILPTVLEVRLLAKGFFLSWSKSYLVYSIYYGSLHSSEACQRTAVSCFSSVVKRRKIQQENSARGGNGLEFALLSSGKVADSKDLKLDLGKLPEVIQTHMPKPFQQPKIWPINFYPERKLLTYKPRSLSFKPLESYFHFWCAQMTNDT